MDAFKKISSPATYAKGMALVDGVPKEMEYVVKHKVKMVFGTDLLSNWENAVEYDNDANNEFKWLAKFMPNIEVLKMATSNAAEMITRGNTHIHQTDDFLVGSLRQENGCLTLDNGTYQVQEWFEIFKKYRRSLY